MANEPRIMSDPYRKFEKDETPKLIQLAADMNKLHADMGGRDNRPERVALLKCMRILQEEVHRAHRQHIDELRERHREGIGAELAAMETEAKTNEPAAVRNPFAARCYTMSESHLSGHRLLVGFEKLEDAQAAHEWIARYGRCDYLHLGVEGIK